MSRVIGVDIVKVLAVLFVVSVHFFLNTNFYSNELVYSRSLILQTTARWLFLICVPLFLITTGYLMSNKRLSSKYYKGLLGIIGVYLFYSVFSILVRVYYFKETKDIENWIFEIFSFTANQYAWYVNMYIGLFLLIPFMNLIFHNLKSKSERLALIGTMVFVCSVPAFFNELPLFIDESKVLFFPNWWIALYPFMYYFIGCFIREYKITINKLFATCLLIFILLLETGLTYYFSNGGPFVFVMGEYASILVALSAALFFIIIYDLEVQNTMFNKTVSLLGSLTLDIYLCSYIIDRVVYQFAWQYVFDPNYPLYYYFVPIVFTVFFISSIISISRKLIMNFIVNQIRLLKSFKKKRKNNLA